jgi:hypothetical protein
MRAPGVLFSAIPRHPHARQRRTDPPPPTRQLPRRHHRRRPDERSRQYPVPDRLLLHARHLRPRAAEPQRRDPRRSFDPGGRAVRLPGSSRLAARAGAVARRHRRRRSAALGRAPGHRADAAVDAGQGRRVDPATRPRSGAELPGEPGTGRAGRPAVDAVLPRDLLRLPSADRRSRAWRRASAGTSHPANRPDDAPPWQDGRDRGQPAERHDRGRPAQRGGGVRHGDGRAHGGALERRQPPVPGQPAPHRGRHRRLQHHFQDVPHDVAIGHTGARRLPRHQPAGVGRHHHRLIDPDLAGAGARRTGAGALEGLRRCPPGLDPAQGLRGGGRQPDETDAAAQAMPGRAPRRRLRLAPWQQAGRAAQCELHGAATRWG